MAQVKIYSTQYCPYCIRAKHLLDSKGVSYEELDVSGNAALRQQMRELSGGYTVPQIFINNRPIGGCDELFALEQQQKLDPLLKETLD